MIDFTGGDLVLRALAADRERIAEERVRDARLGARVTSVRATLADHLTRMALRIDRDATRAQIRRDLRAAPRA